MTISPSEQVGPTRAAEVVRRRIETSQTEFSAFWVQVSGNRDEYAGIVRSELENYGVAVIVLRRALFADPNSVLSDLVGLLESSQEECARAFAGSHSRMGIVLIARNALTTAQASSPALMPEWVPGYGGLMLSVTIEDITWTADAPLSCTEASLEDMRTGLFELEGALLNRLAAVRDVHHGRSNALMTLLRRKDNETLVSLLESVRSSRSAISSPTSFRPSLRDGQSLIARLWEIVQQHHPEALGRPAKALAAALALPQPLTAQWHESLQSVFRRPSGGEPDGSLRFARNLLVTVASAAQFTTSAAHADDYRRYPVLLLRATSFDVRLSLSSSAALLRTLDPVV